MISFAVDAAVACVADADDGPPDSRWALAAFPETQTVAHDACPTFQRASCDDDAVADAVADDGVDSTSSDASRRRIHQDRSDRRGFLGRSDL